MTIRVTYENTETGQTETAELPDNDWLVLCGRSSTIAEAMWNGISRRNGIMRGFRVDELTNQAFDGLLDAPLLFQPITEAQREEAHRATLKASLLFREYVSQALYALPEARQAEARRLAEELGLLGAPEPRQAAAPAMTQEQCEQSGGHQYDPKRYGHGPSFGPCIRCGWSTPVKRSES